MFDYLVRQFSGDEVRVPPAPLPVLAVDPAALAAAPPASGLRAFWIGHASVYVEIDGLRLLLDPVFAERVSPIAIGPKRFHPPPIALADLPKIDAVLVSHDHYDHLDMETVQHLAARGTRFFVPLGIGAHLERWGVPLAQIEEMEWWQRTTLGGVEFVCTPTRHYSGRGLRPQRDALVELVGARAAPSLLLQRRHRLRNALPGHRRAPRPVRPRLRQDRRLRPRRSRGSTSTCRPSSRCRRTATCARSACSRSTGRPSTSRTTTGTSRSAAPSPRRVARGVELVTPRLGEWVDADREFASTPWWEAVR